MLVSSEVPCNSHALCVYCIRIVVADVLLFRKAFLEQYCKKLI